MVDFRDRVDRILDASLRNFGEEIILLPQAGGRKKIRGIFDNEFEIIDPDTEQTISSNQPVVGVNLHNIRTDPKVGDQVKIRNLLFRIYDVREDGQGGAQLFLHKVDHVKKVLKKKSS